MQGHFYFTQQQLSGFAVAFPLDSICNGDWLWLSHVVPHHRNPACGNRQELGQAKAVAYCPHPQRHQEGLACPHTGAATHSQTGRASQPWHIPKNKWEHKNHPGFGLYSN